MVSAVHNKEAKRCKGVSINISGVSNNFFIDRNDVYAIIKNYGGDSTLKKPLAYINLKSIEAALEKDEWIKNAELYFDNNNILKVSVEEREPVARIFTTSGNTFYIDSSCMMLPLSDKFSARLPVFTGFSSDAKILSAADSNLLSDIKNISITIQADSFLMAMIDQLDITAQRNFEITPKMGRQNIFFGDGADVKAKFAKLKLFYKEVITKAGWNRYSTIDLQYKDQVLAKIKGKEDIAADSLQTLKLMKFIADNAAKHSADSLQTFLQDAQNNTADSNSIQTSAQRDESEGQAISTTEKVLAPFVSPAIITVPAVAVPAKPVVIKPVTVKPVTSKPIKLAVVKTPVSKPVFIKPVYSKPLPTVVSTAKKPAAQQPKPKITIAKKLVIKNPVVEQKPKIIMPKKTNDY